MPQLKQNAFSSYELTEAEAEAGMVLTELNKAVIQNYIAGAATEKISADVEDTLKYKLQQANLQGQMEAFQLLLQFDEMIAAKRLEEAQLVADQQSNQQ